MKIKENVCVKCRQSRQYYNGKKYCELHHPQRICKRCNRNANKYLAENEWCEACIREYIKAHQLPLKFAEEVP